MLNEILLIWEADAGECLVSNADSAREVRMTERYRLKHPTQPASQMFALDVVSVCMIVNNID